METVVVDTQYDVRNSYGLMCLLNYLLQIYSSRRSSQHGKKTHCLSLKPDPEIDQNLQDKLEVMSSLQQAF